MRRVEWRWIVALVVVCPAMASYASAEANRSALTYSPWSKYCLGETCFVGTEGSTVDCGRVIGLAFLSKVRAAIPS